MKPTFFLRATALLAVCCLAFGGCGREQPDLTSRSTTALYYQGDVQAAVNIHSTAQPADNSYCLHESMLGSAYLALGDSDDAYRAIRTAYEIMSGYVTDQGGDPHFFKPESDKTFIGDPVEMSLNSWYMAVLNFQRHDYSNCVAACKSAILADQPLKWEEQSEEDAKKNLVPTEHYVDDNGMLYLLEVRGMLRAGWTKTEIDAVSAKGKEAFLRCESLFDPSVAKERVDSLFDRARDPHKNVIFVIDLGLCPKHIGVGEYKERIKIVPCVYPDTNARVVINGQVMSTERVCDVAYQAIHRGERNFDETLNGRAQFAHDAMQGGQVGVGVGVALMTSDNANARAAGAVVAGLGLLFMAMSASTHPEADLRQWEALPGQVNMVFLEMKPGTYSATCEGLDLSLSPLSIPRTCTRSFEVKEGSDTLVYLRPLPLCANPTPAPVVPANQAGDNAANQKQIEQSNDNGKDAFAKDKEKREKEEKEKQAKPTPAPGPSSNAPVTPAPAPTAVAPVTPTPAPAPAPAPVDEHPGTWSTTASNSTAATPPAPAPTTPAGGAWNEK